MRRSLSYGTATVPIGSPQPSIHDRAAARAVGSSRSGGPCPVTAGDLAGPRRPGERRASSRLAPKSLGGGPSRIRAGRAEGKKKWIQRVRRGDRAWRQAGEKVSGSRSRAERLSAGPLPRVFVVLARSRCGLFRSPLRAGVDRCHELIIARLDIGSGFEQERNPAFGTAISSNVDQVLAVLSSDLPKPRITGKRTQQSCEIIRRARPQGIEYPDTNRFHGFGR